MKRSWSLYCGAVSSTGRNLRRSSADFSYLRLSRAKIMLTKELIAKKIGSCDQMSSVDDLKMLSREVQFKKRLTSQVERLEEFKNMGLTEMILDGKRTTL
ncbi:GL15710 [Drosophila persimilis]|uniref:GL15710 n=1 Tax=Drosophila persimilis TaxID=7234 RepID=B4H8Y1_DROPE|nr:GL15710 [Drosophila persimilis]